MGFDVNIDFDEDELRNSIIDASEKAFQEYIENEIGEGHLECDCGSRSFDVETWKTSNGEIEGAAVCRDCNERTEIETDTSDLDDLRR